MLYSKQRQINEFIDHGKDGLEDSMRLIKDGKILDMDVRVSFSHAKTQDLTIRLEGPDGTRVVLHKKEKLKGQHFTQIYNGKTLKKFIGKKSKGQWTLSVVDAAGNEKGYLSSWTLNMRFTEPRVSEIIQDGPSKKDLSSKHYCSEGGKVDSMKAAVEIQHHKIGHLKVKLTSPSGKTVVLHNKEGGDKKNLKKKYKKADLEKFTGENAKGSWTLEVADPKCKEPIHIKSWSLDIVSA